MLRNLLLMAMAVVVYILGNTVDFALELNSKLPATIFLVCRPIAINKLRIEASSHALFSHPICSRELLCVRIHVRKAFCIAINCDTIASIDSNLTQIEKSRAGKEQAMISNGEGGT